MSAIARHLQSVGHSVTFHTSENFRDQFESTGIRFVAMTGKANLDYRRLPDPPDRRTASADDLKMYVLKNIFADTISDQHRGIQQILEETPIDVVLIDTMLFGAFPMLLGPKHKRPPVIGCGVNPVMLSSRDCGLISPPDDSAGGKLRILEEHQRVQSTFRPISDAMDSMMNACGAPHIPGFFLDCMYLLPDVFLQFTAKTFEFPRSDMPNTMRFAGPLLPRPSVEFKEPSWWSELDTGKPVVLVTQGTLANQDFNELIQPVLLGLADENVIVVAATGRTDTQTIVTPDNARIASFVPFDKILPKVDVFVTNGGYGAANHAFSLGVPIVVAGDSEEKDYIAARVGWTRAGINLKTRYATPEQVRDAVRSILTEKHYRHEAQRLRTNFSRYDALAEIARTVDAMLPKDNSMMTRAGYEVSVARS
jgi:MGT family glycosyltransferase